YDGRHGRRKEINLLITQARHHSLFLEPEHEVQDAMFVGPVQQKALPAHLQSDVVRHNRMGPPWLTSFRAVRGEAPVVELHPRKGIASLLIGSLLCCARIEFVFRTLKPLADP